MSVRDAGFFRQPAGFQPDPGFRSSRQPSARAVGPTPVRRGGGRAGARTLARPAPPTDPAVTPRSGGGDRAFARRPASAVPLAPDPAPRPPRRGPRTAGRRMVARPVPGAGLLP